VGRGELGLAGDVGLGRRLAVGAEAVVGDVQAAVRVRGGGEPGAGVEAGEEVQAAVIGRAEGGIAGEVLGLVLLRDDALTSGGGEVFLRVDNKKLNG